MDFAANLLYPVAQHDFVFIQAMVEIIEQLRRYNIPASSLSLNALLNACDKAQAYRVAVSLYGTKIHPSNLDPISVGVLLKSCDKLQMPELAAQIVRDVLKTGRRLPFFLLYQLFAILTKADAVALVLEFLVLVERDAHVGDDLFGLAPVGQPLTDSTYATNVLADQNKQEQEKNLENHDRKQRVNLKKEKIDRDNEDDQSMEENLRALLSLESMPHPSTQRLYAAAIVCLAHTTRIKAAQTLLDSYVTRGGVELEEMYASIIYAHKFTRDVSAAQVTFGRLYKRYRESVELKAIEKLNVSAAQAAAVARVATGRPQVWAPLTVSIGTYNSLLTVYAVCKTSIAETETLLEEMELLDLKWDTYTYTALMMGESDSNRIVALWRNLVHSGLEPTAAAVAETLRSCIQCSAGLVAFDVLRWLWNLPCSFDPPSTVDTVKPDHREIQVESSGATIPTATMQTASEVVQSRTGNFQAEKEVKIATDRTTTRETSVAAAGGGEELEIKGGGEEFEIEGGEGRGLEITRDGGAGDRKAAGSRSKKNPLTYSSAYEREGPPSSGSAVTRVLPDQRLCGFALMALYREERGDLCLALLEEMRTRQVTPLPVHYSLTMGALAKSLEWRRAVNLVLQVGSGI